jgi:class 3 adenylate cyclase
MAAREEAVRLPGLPRDWDRRSRWTLRFADTALERSYTVAMAAPASSRLRVACILGAAIWVTLGGVGPLLLGVPEAPIYATSIVNASWDLAVAALITVRAMTLSTVWTFAFVTATLGALSMPLAFGTGETFVLVGAAALMTNGVFGIALVRLAAWLAAGLTVMTFVVFATVSTAFGIDGIDVYQAGLMIGLLSAATLGARYLEGAERSAFAQANLIAILHRRVDRLFRQYLSPEVAQAMVDDPTRADLGGEVTDVTVLFADLAGFTGFSERTPAPEVVAMLNTAFGAAVPAVFAEGGTVVQFMGDALMAVFNAPIRQPDHALRACRAGLKLQRLMAGVDLAPDCPRFRVGINSGPALVGNIGSADLHNFLAIGDTTNVAARVQSFAAPGTIALAQPTYDLVRDDVDVRSLGVPDLKGKTIATEVYELLGLRASVRFSGGHLELPATSEAAEHYATP